MLPAIASVRRACGAFPMDELGFPGRHHLAAAEGWLGLGDDQEAERELAKLEPSAQAHPSVLEVQWRLHSGRGAWKLALRAARRLVEAAPERPSGWIHQSYCLHELRRTGEAFEALQSVVGRFPRECVIPYNLACYACQLGDLDAARRWLEQAVQVGGRAMIRQMALDDQDLAPLKGFVEGL